MAQSQSGANMVWLICRVCSSYFSKQMGIQQNSRQIFTVKTKNTKLVTITFIIFAIFIRFLHNSFCLGTMLAFKAVYIITYIPKADSCDVSIGGVSLARAISGFFLRCFIIFNVSGQLSPS